MRRVATLLAVVALAATFLAFDARAQSPAHELQLCDPAQGDRPEEAGQLQGDVPRAHRAKDGSGVSRAEQGYNCGLSFVGHTKLDGVGGRSTSNANMAWAGHCAYVAGSSAAFGSATPNDANGVAVVDVSDPANPRHAATLNSQWKGASAASTTVLETIHARENGNRALLVVGTYGNQSGGNKPMDIYDVSSSPGSAAPGCEKPRHLTTFYWPENIHNLTISEDLNYVYATQPLQALDISKPTKPRYLGNIEDVMPYPLVATGPFPDVDDGLPQPVREARKDGYSAHEAWPVTEMVNGQPRQVLYLGGQLPTFEAFTIADITDWLDRSSGQPAGPPKILSQREGRGHSMRTATITGTDGELLRDDNGNVRRFALHSEESVFSTAYGCLSEELNPFAGAAEPWLTEATDLANPKMRISQFHLEINQRQNCGAQFDSRVQASVHYHDFDRADGARFAILSMQNAGIRVIDVRRPGEPVEIGYFNPGDVDKGPGERLDNAWAHSRYVEETGHIWFATASGGFWVVALEPQVRARLGMAPVSTSTATGTADLASVTFGPLGPEATDTARLYCTLGGVQ
jgi:hypothetical protein